VPATPEARRAGELAAALRLLTVEIDAIDVRVDAVSLPSYPGGPRPTSVVVARGRGCRGYGEHVGWSPAAHARFRHRASGLVDTGRRTVSEFSEQFHRRSNEPYDRAALEAAVIDLALRQADTSLAELIDVRGRETRYVVSFAPAGDPTQALGSALGSSPEIQAKIDVDPEWATPTFERLAATGRVAILDWKGRDVAGQHATAHRLLPETILEDPGAEPLHEAPAIDSRRSVDGPFTHARALDDAATPAAANVKPARMGGVLEALDGVERCAARGVSVYFGGMFELGPGRRQLLDLASVLSPDGPNDIAPIPTRPLPPAWLPRLEPPSGPGFGTATRG